MINLIPIEERKEVRKDFYYRLLIVFLGMLVFVMIISLLAILPTYFISLENKISMSQRLEKQKNEIMPEIDQKSLVAIKELDTRLALLEKSRKNKYVFSEMVVNELLSDKVAGIKIKSISYENDSSVGGRINLTGLSENREQLLLFRRTLENNPSFKDVDLPISNFVKGRDIQFSLSLISIPNEK
jgi:Tfp pilus assembly protein PilN